MKSKLLLSALILMIMSACTTKPKTAEEKEKENNGVLKVHQSLTPKKSVKDRLNIYGSFELTSDISHLTPEEKQVLPILFEVANIMKDLFWKQTLGNKENFLSAISNKEALKMAKINYGPWDRLDNNKPFIKEIGAKPAGANFYPTDMTKEEFEKWKDPNKNSLYTLIRRDEKGNLKSIWYHEAYQTELKKASDLLKKAAGIVKNEKLKRYFNLRADALLSSKYLESDFAWMEMQNANIDFVVGPIENYEDALYGYKAAFESFILIKDPEWSKRLAKYASMLPALQKQLPVKPEYKKEVPGSKADLNAYDAIYYAGDCDAGSKTIAINLPNAEQVHLKYGTRKLMLKNAMRAKFEKILVPIANVLLDPAQRKHVTFNAFFENTMFHEVGHAMGIKNTITNKGTAREALKEIYSSVEEGKADIMGLFLVTKMYENGELTAGELKDNYTTFFTSIFRSIRFGAASAHGVANMMRFNYFLDKGAFKKNADGTYTVNYDKMYDTMVSLLQEILYAQGDGDYEKTKKWVKKIGVVSEDLQKDLDKLNNSGIPVDVIFDQGIEHIKM